MEITDFLFEIKNLSYANRHLNIADKFKLKFKRLLLRSRSVIALLLSGHTCYITHSESICRGHAVYLTRVNMYRVNLWAAFRI